MNSEIVFRSATNADCAEIQRLVFSVLSEYGLHPDPAGTDADIIDIERFYIGNGGIFEVLEDVSGKIVGTVGLFPMDSKTVELRKMYFCREIRGRGLGKLTIERMIETSRERGFTKIFLETASVLKEAIGLYRKYGFVESSEKHTPRCDLAFYLEIEN